MEVLTQCYMKIVGISLACCVLFTEHPSTMKISFCFCFVAVAVLSSTFVDSLPLTKKYSTRLQQEEYFKKHGYYNLCLGVESSENGTSENETFEGDDLDAEQFVDGNGEEANEVGKPVDPDEESFQSVVICFQKKYSLRQTGVVDEATRDMMELMESDFSDDYLRRKKRFVITRKWEKNNLTYYIKNYDVDRDRVTMTQQTIRSEMQAAIKMWTDVTNVTVKELNSTTADIVIGFYPDFHGDSDFHDGNLGHAFRPGGSGISGDIHLRKAVGFTAFSFTGVNLRYVVAHEFGHAIGLDHSKVPGSIMAPDRMTYNPDQKLGEDDVKGIQSLYGKK